jgi:hypothetical protein
MRGFKQFLLRGNVVDLAVGIVIGAAFAGVGVCHCKRHTDPAHWCHSKIARFLSSRLHDQRQQILVR